MSMKKVFLIKPGHCNIYKLFVFFSSSEYLSESYFLIHNTHIFPVHIQYVPIYRFILPLPETAVSVQKKYASRHIFLSYIMQTHKTTCLFLLKDIYQDSYLLLHMTHWANLVQSLVCRIVSSQFMSLKEQKSRNEPCLWSSFTVTYLKLKRK